MSFVVICDSVNCQEQKYLQATNVSYTADIHSGFALCKLVQVYHISMPNIMEAIYQFPVDYNSAFCDLVVHTPREDIRGIVKESSEAKQIYINAKNQGRQAFLAEETKTDRDIYKLSMCNINNGDTITVEYTYITELTYQNGQNVFYIPSFISARYGGNFIPNPKHSIDIKITIGSDPNDLICSVANVLISVENGCLVLRHKSSSVLDADIEIKFASEHIPKAYKFESKGFNMAMMQFIPTSEKTSNSVTKNIIFVLDCSGSMSGDRIKNSISAIVHCLEKLMGNDGYKFNIIRYGSRCDIYSDNMLNTNEKNINEAIKYCRNIKANLGGTETFKALRKCLEFSRNAILITDGDISGSVYLHKLCSQFDSLSVLGIGSGINRANIKDMASLGSGVALFCQNETNIIDNVDIIFKSITSGSIKKYAIDWKNNNQSISSTKPVIFDQLNTLYSIIYADTTVNIFDMLVAGISMNFEPLDLPFSAEYIGAITAKRIIQDNEISDYFTKEKLIDLAVKFNIITKYTSMVAVGNESFEICSPHPSVTYQQSLISSTSYNIEDRYSDKKIPSINSIRPIVTNDIKYAVHKRMNDLNFFGNKGNFEEIIIERNRYHRQFNNSYNLDKYNRHDESIRATLSEPITVNTDIEIKPTQIFDTNLANVFYTEIRKMRHINNITKIIDHFDSDKGLFLQSIGDVITDIPIRFMVDDLLTTFVMYYLNQTNIALYKKYYELIKINNPQMLYCLNGLGLIEPQIYKK
jgi:hypothetical protein